MTAVESLQQKKVAKKENKKEVEDDVAGFWETISYVLEHISTWQGIMTAMLFWQILVIYGEYKFEVDAVAQRKGAEYAGHMIFDPALLALINMRFLTFYVQIGLMFTMLVTKPYLLDIVYKLLTALGFIFMVISLITAKLSYIGFIQNPLEYRVVRDFPQTWSELNEYWESSSPVLKDKCQQTTIGLFVNILTWIVFECYTKKDYVRWILRQRQPLHERYYAKIIAQLSRYYRLFLGVSAFMSFITIMMFAITSTINQNTCLELYVGLLNSFLSFIPGFITFCMFSAGFKPDPISNDATATARNTV